MYQRTSRARQICARLLNATIIFLHDGGSSRPFVEHGVHVLVLDGITTRTYRTTDRPPPLTASIGWLLIEFPRRREEDLPFTTIAMEGGSRLLVFELPTNFSFAVSEVSQDCVVQF